MLMLIEKHQFDCGFWGSSFLNKSHNFYLKEKWQIQKPNPKFSLLLFSLKAPSFSHVLLHPFPRMRLDPLSRQDALFFFLELVIYGWMKLVRLYVLMLKKTLFCWAQGFSLVSSPWEPKLEDLKVNECLHFSMFCCYEFIQGMKMVMWWNWGEGLGFRV